MLAPDVPNETELCRRNRSTPGSESTISVSGSGAAGPGAESHIATVDAHVLTGHERRLVAGQEQDQVGDVLAGADSTERMCRAIARKRRVDAIGLAGSGGAHELRIDRA